MIENRQKQKIDGFHIASPTNTPVDYSKILVGSKKLQNAIVISGKKKSGAQLLGDKEYVLNAMHNEDLSTMRQISDFFFRTSGIYSRLCRYLAYLYRYDWTVTPFIALSEREKEKTTKKVLDVFYNTLYSFDNLELKRLFGDVALKVIKNGCYYGYIIKNPDKIVLQELPAAYCRTRYLVDNRPAVEFNVKYFDDQFSNNVLRDKILNLFPKEFKKAYDLYKAGKLPKDYPGDTAGWVLLDINCAVKFNINNSDMPFLIAVIPAIIDLDAAQELDRKKMQQKLLKLLIQKLPRDKNGELIFDVDEAAQLHSNAVQMLADAIGIDVLTTFADVEVADTSDRNSTTTVDDLNKVERAIFNEAGISQMQFNTDGNIALEKSILNDEASMYNLICQFENFLNLLLADRNKTPKKFYFRAQILPTTIYNYKEMAKLYKEQTQIGFSKMLPQIAMGQSQSAILANAYFENDLLDLVRVFIPPLSSNVLNADILGTTGLVGNGANETKQSGTGDSDSQGGRPTKESQGETVTEKTMQNKESAS